MVGRDNLEGHIVRSYWKLDKRPQGGLGCWQAVRRVSDLLQMAETPWKADFMSKFVPSAIQCGICHTKWEIKLGTNVTILVHPYQPWSRRGKRHYMAMQHLWKGSWTSCHCPQWGGAFGEDQKDVVLHLLLLLGLLDHLGNNHLGLRTPLRSKWIQLLRNSIL